MKSMSEYVVLYAVNILILSSKVDSSVVGRRVL